MKVLFISDYVLDASYISLLKSLKKKTDLYCLFDVQTSEHNIFNLDKPLEKDIHLASEIEKMNNFEEYIPKDKTYIINRPHKLNILCLIVYQIKIYRLIKKIDPDIIHCYNELGVLYYLFLLLNRKKIVLTVHDPITHSGWGNFMTTLRRKISFFTINKHILLNRMQTQEYKEKYKRNEKDIYFSALSIYESLKCYGRASDERTLKLREAKIHKFNILFFGRIFLYKGVDYLMKAFEELQEEGINDVSLTVAGAGEYYFEISKYNNNSNINIINRVLPHEELNGIIEESSIVVCPYIDATQSGVIMTAFAFNIPVIATDVGGLKEMIDDGKTGILIPPRNVEAIKDAIKLVYENPKLLKQMSQNITDEWRIGKRSWDSITDGLVEIYNDIIYNK